MLRQNIEKDYAEKTFGIDTRKCLEIPFEAHRGYMMAGLLVSLEHYLHQPLTEEFPEQKISGRAYHKVTHFTSIFLYLQSGFMRLFERLWSQ